MKISEGRLPRISSVKAVGEHRLRLRFSNGELFTVDLKQDVKQFMPFRPLRDRATFARAAVGEGGHSIIWVAEGLDMGADTLWQYALEQNGRADAVEFIRWRWRNGLSLTSAAEALGLSRRQVAYYGSGKHKVPRTVLLACKGWEAEHQRHAAA
jgi:Protein of unknown function (DUF2442)